MATPRRRRAPKTQVLPATVSALARDARKAQKAFERAAQLAAHQQRERARRAAARPAPAAPPRRRRRSSVPDEIPFDLIWG